VFVYIIGAPPGGNVDINLVYINLISSKFSRPVVKAFVESIQIY